MVIIHQHFLMVIRKIQANHSRYFKKNNLSAFSSREFRLDSTEGFKVGEINVSSMEGQYVDVSSNSIEGFCNCEKTQFCGQQGYSWCFDFP